MDATTSSLDSIYHYLKHNVQSATTKSELMPYIFAEFTNINHLKEFISISLEKQYKMEKRNHFHFGNKLHSLYLSLREHINIQPIKVEDEYLNVAAVACGSNADSDCDPTHNEETDASEHESEYGADFAIAGHGETTIVYTDSDHDEAHHHHTHIINVDLLRELSIDDIKESEPESTPSSSHYMSNHSDSQTLEQCDDFKTISKMKEIGSKKGVVVKSQIAENHTLAIQILNRNVDKMGISKIKIVFHNNCIGATSTTSDVSLPIELKYNHGFAFLCPLELDMNKVDKSVKFGNNIGFIVNTNLFEIRCEVNIPMYLFFEPRQELKPDKFLFLWKSVPDKECKLKLNKCKICNIEELKALLLLEIYNLWFMYHRTIQQKGSILYYSCAMHGIVILIEIAVALQGKGTVITRSHDKHKSMLCALFIQSLIDACD